MSRRRSPKPATPEQIQAQAVKRRAEEAEQRAREKVADKTPEAWGANVSSLTMPANANVAVTMDKVKSRQVQTAKRMDAFAALESGMPTASYVAARRLQTDITIRKGEQDRGRNFDRVDCDAPTDRTDAMIAAAKRIEAVLARLGGHTQWLLSELASPSDVIRLNHQSWRSIVQYITGEEDAMAQAGAVRHACKELALVYAELDRAPRRAMA